MESAGGDGDGNAGNDEIEKARENSGGREGVSRENHAVVSDMEGKEDPPRTPVGLRSVQPDRDAQQERTALQGGGAGTAGDATGCGANADDFINYTVMLSPLQSTIPLTVERGIGSSAVNPQSGFSPIPSWPMSSPTQLSRLLCTPSGLSGASPLRGSDFVPSDLLESPRQATRLLNINAFAGSSPTAFPSDLIASKNDAGDSNASSFKRKVNFNRRVTPISTPRIGSQTGSMASRLRMVMASRGDMPNAKFAPELGVAGHAIQKSGLPPSSKNSKKKSNAASKKNASVERNALEERDVNVRVEHGSASVLAAAAEVGLDQSRNGMLTVERVAAAMNSGASAGAGSLQNGNVMAGWSGNGGARTLPNNLAGCKCKKNECLKMYCICFAAQVGCGKDCSCENCKNREEYSELVEEARKVALGRNPRCFDPKVLHQGTVAGGGEVVPSDMHLRGCKCRKTRCLQKYCDCFQEGVRCGPRCVCIGCENKPNAHDTKKAASLAHGSNPLIEALPEVELATELKQQPASLTTTVPLVRPLEVSPTIRRISFGSTVDGADPARATGGSRASVPSVSRVPIVAPVSTAPRASARAARRIAFE